MVHAHGAACRPQPPGSARRGPQPRPGPRKLAMLDLLAKATVDFAQLTPRPGRLGTRARFDLVRIDDRLHRELPVEHAQRALAVGVPVEDAEAHAVRQRGDDRDEVALVAESWPVGVAG